jgi:thioredoxin reductase (NADPH)
MKQIFTFVLCSFGAFAAPLQTPAVEVVESVQTYPTVIIGGGTGAMTSAIYLGRAGVEPLVIEGGNPGGLITQSHSVQNWPGEMEIAGPALAEKIRKQAEANGARFLRAEVIGVDFSKRPFTLTIRDLDTNRESRIKTESVIIAMGTTPNFLGIPGEQTYWGHGVTNCAICDGSLYKDQVVGVVGGGDAAVLEALYLSNIAKEVHVFIRKESFKGTEEKRLQTMLEKPNVKVHYRTQVEEVKGNGEAVTAVRLQDGKEIALDGLFLAIGSKPNTKLFQNALELDGKGYILLKKDQETAIAGVYAIGDIVDPVYKQAISAAGDGAKAALQAQQYLSDRANQLVVKKKSAPTILPTVIEVIEITSAEQFQKELDSSDVPVFVDFYATWCGPCKRISPMIDSMANQLSGRVKFLKVNVDRVSQLTHQYQIRSMPTVLLIDPNGTLIERKVGSDQIAELLRKLEQNQ